MLFGNKEHLTWPNLPECQSLVEGVAPPLLYIPVPQTHPISVAWAWYALPTIPSSAAFIPSCKLSL